MFSPADRRSADNIASPVASPSSSQYSTVDTPQRPGSSGRYGKRRGSAASSITSIGGVLDTVPQVDPSIAEVGNNGLS